LLNHWSDVGDIGYYGNSEGLCGGVSAIIGSDVDVHIANSVNTDTVFVFDPANTDAGILTITLKAITNTHSSERVGDIGYYGNSEGLCGGVSAIIGSDVDVHIANSVNTDFSF
jgi:hypothetical protein